MKESNGYHLGRAAMTALIIWGFFVLAIDGCNSLIRERATEECWNDSKSKGKTDTSDLIECLEDLGLDESQISASLRERGFDLKNN